jgi:prepilin signal peptidase PulO-like enzyme (type II secretory pathway)
VNAFIALPLPLRLAMLGAMGLAAGSLINAGIYALAWFSRPISPWQPPHAQAPPRRSSDFLPIVGWIGLAREASLHGRGFWIRPLVIELCCAIGLPALYWWEATGKLAPLLPIPGFAPATAAMLHHEFVSHAILMGLMLVATFIDFDEKTIPDEVTIPGTLVSLAFAVLWPDSHLPVDRPIVPLPIAPPFKEYQPLLLTSTSDWPAWLNDVSGAAVGVAIFVGWCIALIPALCTLRRGWWNGVRFYFASIARESAWWKMLILAVLGGAAIIAVWHRDGESWQALFTSLVGLGFGGGLVWAVRIAGRIALHKEAMGFGDVTLMAMIGAFLGWQPCLMVFFLSPFAALVIALVQVALTGRRDIPYGPYLCAATVVVIVRWPWFWQHFGGIFLQMGWLLLWMMAGCLVLMMALLTAWRLIERAIWKA